MLACVAHVEPDEYVAGRPHAALAGHVVRYGGYREFSPTPVRRRQVPTGACALILSFGPVLRLAGPAGPSTTASFLAGVHDAAVITEFAGVQHGLQVDLTPLGVYELLGRPMPELTNITASLDELEIPHLASLPARLAEETGWPQRFARVDAVLLALLESARVQADREVRWAWHELVRTDGRIPVQRLAAEVGWSRRHLLTRFRGQIGLAPKPAARVLRLQRAAGLLVPRADGGGPGSAVPQSLADVAAACGFSDHAHLVREFRALAGCTPTEYMAGWS